MRTTRSPYQPFPLPRQARGRTAPGIYRVPQYPAPFPYAPRRAARAGFRRPVWPWLVMGGLGLAALMAVLLIAGVYGYILLTGRVLPGAYIGQYPAGSLTEAELIQKLDTEWNQQQIVLTDGEHAWPAAPGDLGIKMNAAETAARAVAVGRGTHGLAQMLWLARFGKIQVEPVIISDPAAGRAGLERLAAQINRPAQNAALRLQDGRWVAVPGQNGSSLNIDETLRLIAAQPVSALEEGIQPIMVNPVTPQVTDLTPALGRLQEAMQRPLTVEAYDPITDETLRIAVPEERLAGWITVEPQGDDIAVGLDGSQMAPFLEEWQASLGPDRTLAPFTVPADLNARWQNQQPVTVIIAHKPTSYTVEPGDSLTRIAFKMGMPYWKIQQANPEVDANRLTPGQTLVIPSRNEMLPLPIVPGKRVVISISQQQMWTYENGSLRSEHVISTGIDRSPTIPGIYQIQTHEPLAYASVWDLTMPHFMGIYEGWPGFMNGIHGLPTLSNGQRLWSGSLGRPVSYGCIILGLEEAEDLYHWAEAGVIVEIQP